MRKGYTQECSNVGQLLKNLSFTLNMESTLMGNVLDDKMKPDAAAKAWLKENPEVLDTWLAGVTTVDGKPGLEAVKALLSPSNPADPGAARCPGCLSLLACGHSLPC